MRSNHKQLTRGLNHDLAGDELPIVVILREAERL